jgi:hypothetical protein
MDASTQQRAKAKWLALSVGLTLGVLFICSDFFFLRDYSRTCGREEEEEFSSFARSLTAAAAGQRRVVHASAAYPLDQARTSSCRLDPALRQVLVIRTCGPLTPVRPPLHQPLDLSDPDPFVYLRSLIGGLIKF